MRHQHLLLDPKQKLTKKIARAYIGRPVFFRQISTERTFSDCVIVGAWRKYLEVRCDQEVRYVPYNDIDNIVVYVQ